jgi:hypothetical protein
VVFDLDPRQERAREHRVVAGTAAPVEQRQPLLARRGERERVAEGEHHLLRVAILARHRLPERHLVVDAERPGTARRLEERRPFLAVDARDRLDVPARRRARESLGHVLPLGKWRGRRLDSRPHTVFCALQRSPQRRRQLRLEREPQPHRQRRIAHVSASTIASASSSRSSG